MLREKRPHPSGIAVSKPFDLRRFLPYRIHVLAAKIATAPAVTLESGILIRARDWRVIVCLGNFGPLTNSELADVIGMDSASITRAVQYLLEHSLVERRISKRDRRKQLIALTEEGARAHDTIAPMRQRAADAIERHLTAEEHEQLFNLLDKVDEAYAHAEAEDLDEWLD